MAQAIALVWQFGLNILLALDHLLNTLLLGDPNETVSRRTARAAQAGSEPAATFCKIMSWFRKNHCANSLTAGTQGKELWAWSPWQGEPDIDG